MKKEIYAVILLVVMFAGAIINNRYISVMTGEIETLSEQAGAAAASEDWEKAAKYAETAVKEWARMDKYTHIVLRHSEIDTVSDALYELLKEANSENGGGAEGAAQQAAYHLRSISEMERLKLGSIL